MEIMALTYNSVVKYMYYAHLITTFAHACYAEFFNMFIVHLDHFTK